LNETIGAKLNEIIHPDTSSQADDSRDVHGKVHVTFVYENTGDETRFKVERSATLNEIWQEAYKELGEQQKPDDQLESAAGISLMGYLSHHVAELRKSDVIASYDFQIRAKTGGA
jgi:hypothetical protein